MIRNVCQAMHLLLLCSFIFLFINPSMAEKIGITTNDIIKNITDPLKYNKWNLPPENPGEALEVQIKANVYYIQTKETNKLTISMHLLLELSWEDSRLRYDEESTGFNIITGGKKVLDAIWSPHVFFTNRVESLIMSSISNDDFVALLPSGLVILTTRLKPSMTCLLHLTKFPFDEQNCELLVHSSSYNSSDLVLSWEEDAPLLFKTRTSSFTEFDVISVENTYSMDRPEQTLEGGQVSSLAIKIKLARHYGYYLLNYYLPSALIVSMSWVTFWLEPAASPGRMTIGASTMLTFIQLCWSALENQKVSQFMVYDVWSITCTAFIFLSLVEFAFVNTIDRKGRGEKLYMKKCSSKYILQGGISHATGRTRLRRSSSCPSTPEIRRHFAHKQDKTRTINELKEVSVSLGNLAHTSSKNLLNVPHRRRSSFMFSMTPQEIAAWIDNKSKYVFPIAFFIFNVIYWLPIIIVT